jgi:hypothetical protein
MTWKWPQTLQCNWIAKKIATYIFSQFVFFNGNTIFIQQSRLLILYRRKDEIIGSFGDDHTFSLPLDTTLTLRANQYNVYVRALDRRNFLQCMAFYAKLFVNRSNSSPTKYVQIAELGHQARRQWPHLFTLLVCQGILDHSIAAD